LASAAIGLTACNREERSPVEANPERARGSARIALPQLPPGFLADSSQKALFALDIVGPGRDTIRRSSFILPGEPAHFLFVDGIPAGLNRFYARLYRLDSAGGYAEQTHVGLDSAVISASREAQLRLYLRQFKGSVQLCIEVEGWPSDFTCAGYPPFPPPPPAGVPRVAGCYTLRVSHTSPGSVQDSVSIGRLEIIQRDSSLLGIIDWQSGGRDSARGAVSGRLARFDDPRGVGFDFRAQIDSAGPLSGPFSDSLRNIRGTGSALPRPTCSPDSEPPPPAFFP
jgi:hypothetical protein